MTTIHALLAEQDLPARHRSRLTQSGHSPSALQAWVDNLPIMNTADTGKKLYQTLQELATLNIPGDDRFELIEILEPAVFNLVSTLNKQIANQPVQLPLPAHRIALLVQYLHQQLVLCYKVVAVETVQKLEGGKVGFLNLGKRSARQLAATALQRVLSEQGRLLHDAYMLYRPVPEGVWKDVHGFFRLGELTDLLDVPVKDRHGVHEPETTVRRSYLRAVMLGASQTQKLRPPEIHQLYAESEVWAGSLAISHEGSGVVVCVPEDRPPVFRQRAPVAADAWQVQGEALVRHLQEQLANPGKLSLSLISHLTDVWRRGKERMFERKPCDKQILICLGLSAAHYYLADQRDFREIVRGDEQEVAASQPAYLFGLEEDIVPEEHPDAWQISYQTVDTRDLPDEAEEEPGAKPVVTYTPYRVQAVNSSPGGYGVVWPKPPAALRPGEIVAICEERGKSWSLGVLQWVRLTGEGRVEAGFEILSALAKPCGVKLVKSPVEDSEPQRGFLVPEMKVLEQPATLVVPVTGFTLGSEVKICLAGQEVRARLTRLMTATSSVCQYEFGMIADGAALPPSQEQQEADDIDTMWEQLKG